MEEKKTEDKNVATSDAGEALRVGAIAALGAGLLSGSSARITVEVHVGDRITHYNQVREPIVGGCA